MNNTFTDMLGSTVWVGDCVAYGVRDGNTGITKAARVVSIDRVDKMDGGYWTVKVRAYASSDDPNFGHRRIVPLSSPDTRKMIKIHN